MIAAKGSTENEAKQYARDEQALFEDAPKESL